jgi:hypothetical protein
VYADDEWSEVAGPKRSALLAAIGKIDDRTPVSESTTRLEQRILPFYRGVTLLRLNDPAWRPDNLRVYYLVADDMPATRVTGASAPIHDTNAGHIALDETNIIDYVRYFCFFVYGDEGPFQILYRRDDPHLPGGFWEMGKGSDGSGARVADVFRPPRFYGRDEKGSFRVGGIVFYGTAVFRADFLVAPTGMIEMVADDPLAADLPGRSYVPIS